MKFNCRMSHRIMKFVSISICLLTASFLFAQEDQTQNQTRTSSETRTLVVTVTDKNGLTVQDLNASSFAVTGDKVSWEVLDARQHDDPIAVAILLDFSRSMGERRKASKRVRDALNALIQFIERSHASNEYCIIGFHDTVFPLTKCFHKSDVAVQVLRKVETLPFDGTGAMFDALEYTVNTLRQSTESKLAILLVTDGMDSSSKSFFKQTARLLEESRVVVYPVYVVADDVVGSALQVEGEGILKDFAKLSGGRVVRSTPDSDLAASLDRVAVELRSQYLVTVRARNSGQQKCQEFKVKVIQLEGTKQTSLDTPTRKTVCG